MLADPIQHFRSAILQAWHFKVTAGLARREGPHLRERDKMLLRAMLSGGVWNGFLLGRAKKEDVPCRFCGGRDGDGHLFWECTFLPFQHVGELPEFATLLRRDRSRWPRCFLWHGWLPGLSCEGHRDCWAASLGQLAVCRLESALGAYPANLAGCWVPPVFLG